MAGTIETFANISAQDLLRRGFRYYGWVRKVDSTGIRKMFHMWPWRFVVLSTGCLYLYEDSQDKNFSEKIPLTKYRACDAQEVSKYAWTLKLVHESYGGKTLFFAVDWELDLEQWKKVITEEKNIWWPLAEGLEETRGHTTASPSTQPKPCKRVPAPLPAESHTYGNVPFNPMNVPVHVVAPAIDHPLPVYPRPPQGSTTSGPPVHFGLSHLDTKSKPTWQSSPVPRPRPHEKTAKKRPPIKPRPHLPNPPSSGKLRKSKSETSLVQERFDNVLGQLTLQTPSSIAEEQDPPTSSKSFSPAGVCTSHKPRTAGRGHPDGQSFKQKTREMVPSTSRLDIDRNEAVSLLKNEHEGVYLLRNSQNVQSGMVLSVATKDEILHSEILYEKDQGYALAADGPTFHTLEGLLRHYHECTTTLQRLTRPYNDKP